MSENNRERNIAEQFILHTDQNVFLTGKAGTGKTTLLREITKKTEKKHIIVAPTGVAAINAGGMTIHSVFQLPPSNFIPDKIPVDPDLFINRLHLAKHQKLIKERIDLLRNLELLIIDEISMVRADLLDAIDHTLRRVRRDQTPFGGVQLLVIGDLYQLAPIMKPEIWDTLKHYYESHFFFSAHSWQQTPHIVIELQHVYRQADQTFVDLLNRIRQGIKTPSDIDVLNSHYDENPPTDEDVITLTTHNRKADKINIEELNKLGGPKHELHAVIEGAFSKSSYPVPKMITVKEGAQVMFVKNHKDGQWFNGKLATVVDFAEEDIIVEDNEERRIVVGREDWKNTKYSVDKTSKEIIKDDVGTYSQYPIRLAWAVTVHKSQGLTFDEVIVDLKNTFAAGQLYVALSRCRSLDGLILSSKISARNIIAEQSIIDYYSEHELPEDVEKQLAKAMRAYDDKLLIRLWDLARLTGYTEDWYHHVLEQDYSSKKSTLTKALTIGRELEEIKKVADRFREQLHQICITSPTDEDQFDTIQDRVAAAIPYFVQQLYTRCLKPVEQHLVRVIKSNKDKSYRYYLADLISEYWYTIDGWYDACYRDRRLYDGVREFKKVKTFDTNEAVNRTKREKGETYKITLEMHKEGRSIEAIAKDRGMATSTIESHIGRLIQHKEIDITEVLDRKKLDASVPVFMDMPKAELAAIRPKLPVLLTWGEMRWVQLYVRQVMSQLDDI